MGRVSVQTSVKLVIGIIAQPHYMAQAVSRLRRIFGPLDYESDTFDFDFTSYYAAEMGTGLKRKFLGFKRRIMPEQLVAIKLRTNRIEQRHFSRNGRRCVNIDPGYLTLSKLVLATTKDHQHRIYLQKGIFAEVTLRFRKRSFTPWEWTYPDYATPSYIAIFNLMRNRMLSQRQRVK